jgi:hypothetical protein
MELQMTNDTKGKAKAKKKVDPQALRQRLTNRQRGKIDRYVFAHSGDLLKWMETIATSDDHAERRRALRLYEAWCDQQAD